MIRIWAALAATLLAGLAAPALAGPLDLYGRLPSIEQVSLSPDGKLFAAVVTNGEQRRILIEDVDSAKLIAGLNAGAIKIRNLQWAGSDHLVVTSSTTTWIPDVIGPKDEYYQAADYRISKNTIKPLMTGVRDSLNVVFGRPDIRFINGRPFAFCQGEYFVSGQGQVGLFKVDLDEGVTTLESPGYAHTRDYVVDAKGKPLAEAEFDATASRWTLRLANGRQWREAQHQTAAIIPPDLMGLGRDGASVLVAFGQDNHTVLKELSADGAAWSAALPQVDTDDLIWDRASHRLIGERTLVGDEQRYQFFDPQDQRTWNAAVKAFPGQQVLFNSFSDDHKRIVALVDSPTEGPSYALVDMNTKHATWIGNAYDGLRPQDIAPVRPIAFKAKDGLALTGYLTLPLGKDPAKLPLVVFPHGGPAARDEPGFDWWAQAMASRGYAVLQVNYRGSDGFGWDFQSAGFGQWGRKMQTDLSDGVRYLAGQGTIDPARVCIVGASYGGYAALAGAALDTGVYRCAAAIAGPADLRKFIAWGQSREGAQGIATRRYWTRYMGDMSSLSGISPAEQAAKVTIPVLLIHGKDDTVVPYEQSRMMADALSKAGKPVEFVTLKSEDHWLSRGETRLLMLQSVVAFLEKNNPP